MVRVTDILGDSFLSQELGPFVINETACNATLVSKQCKGSQKAILYIHGYVDYFFQSHLADQAVTAGYHFYALDLHYCGRSLREGQIPHFCKDVSEYYPEISAALDVIHEHDGIETVIGNFHSTGGPIGLLYTHDHLDHKTFDGLILNSPFLDFNDSWINEEVMIKVVASLGSIFPEQALPGGLSSVYGESVHKDYRGEWDYRLDWKPIAGFPARAGWIRAIQNAHQRIHQGLQLACPILCMFSSASSQPKEFDELTQKTDTVLDVVDIARYSMTLGKDITLKPVHGGMHDLVLSDEPVRSDVMKEMFSWLKYKNL